MIGACPGNFGSGLHLRPVPPRSRFPPLSACAARRKRQRTVPPPQLAEPASGNREVAVLAGGCFWGVEAVYEHVKGVADVRSGFAGGDRRSATYDKVSSGNTRHAEAVRIVYDPRVVSYGDLLRIFFAVAHDPTEVNRQGPDVGPQYRSAIFPQSPAQARVARAYIDQLVEAACVQEADRNEDRARQLRRGRSLSSGLHARRTRRIPTSSSTTSRKWQR